jgi:hypothetical protein
MTDMRLGFSQHRHATNCSKAEKASRPTEGARSSALSQHTGDQCTNRGQAQENSMSKCNLERFATGLGM